MVPLACSAVLGIAACDSKPALDSKPVADSEPAADPKPELAINEEREPSREVDKAPAPAPEEVEPEAAGEEPAEEDGEEDPYSRLEPKGFDEAAYDKSAYDMWEFDELSDPRFVDDYSDATCTDGEDCVAKGKEQFEVGGANKDRRLAFVYFRLGCLQDHAQACFEQGQMFRMMALGSHPFTKWSDTWELELFQKGCELGYGISCMHWGDRLKGAQRKGAYAKSMPLLETGCDAKVVEDCVWLATNLSSGRGGEKDEARAAKLFKAMCGEKDAYACERYALALQEGEGVKKNLKSARKWLRKGCKIDPEGCGKLTGRIRLDGIEPSGG